MPSRRYIVGPQGGGPPYYSTSFPTIENPLSESGTWVNLGATANGFTKMRTAAAGKCYGTNSGAGGIFDDSYAHLTGWENYPNQWVEIIVGLAGGLTNDGFSREIEVHLRANSDNSGGIKLYEFDLSYLGSGCELVRWNGASGSFTVATGTFSGGTQMADGDKWYVELRGNVATVKQNNVSLGTVDVSTDTALSGTVYNSGNPGIGAFIRPTALNSDFWIKSFRAGTLP